MAIAALQVGCMGGTIAQQIARSLVTNLADKAVAKAMDVDEREESKENTHAQNYDEPAAAPQTMAMEQNPISKVPPSHTSKTQTSYASPIRQDPSPDQLAALREQYAWADFQFKTVEQVQAELAASVDAALEPSSGSADTTVAESTLLVNVEVLNLLVGEEKQHVYEKARLIGALNLPKAREWQQWHVATGLIKKDNTLITFIIPPQMGKLPSGSQMVVELAQQGDLNIARYPQH